MGVEASQVAILARTKVLKEVLVLEVTCLVEVISDRLLRQVGNLLVEGLLDVHLDVVLPREELSLALGHV